MTKIQMPEPVAKVIHRSEWGDAPAFIGNGKPHPPTGTLLITTDQAEAYANARVREALEELNNQAQKLYESSLKSRLTRDGAADEDELKAIDLWNVESVGMAKAYTNMQKAIRALMPKGHHD